ncbi:UDP-N-acetylmuramate--L-alanine ligase [Ostreibacterium oceani]|uniref:UDP-N-acetylmuramate--L-alanine ligase n=1 Tax=Ostreibacterium oceani TaxID=2654998 RepID=A0A6N7ETY1_9GAMM|nr:UDP-N-acetylmuramate--L-alanine ligase [Ostreibacterium oceani]
MTCDNVKYDNQPRKHMRRVNHIHFVGIGGAGMNGIAEVMVNLGYAVSGSDIQSSSATQRLQSLGVDVTVGHQAEQVNKADVVVKSTAIQSDNPEIIAAHAARIPVVSRAEMLAEIMRYRFGIAVSGTHGKTTTTSILASLLGDAGLDPTFVIGGVLNRAGTSAKLGQSDYLIAEADESDASFLHLTPMLTVVTNIDADHLETYGGDFSVYRQTFVDFLQRMPFYGLAVVCYDDVNIQKILPDIGRPVVTYGSAADCDIYVKDIRTTGLMTSFDVVFSRDNPSACVTFDLQMPGKHNVLNALAAIAVAHELDVPMQQIQQGVANFNGVGRRFTLRGYLSKAQAQIPVFEDYGHHPRELSAVLSAAKAAFPDKRIFAVFQPHRFSRTRDLFDDFANVLAQFDKLILTRVYAAGEAHIPDADGRALARAIRARGGVEPIFVPEFDKISEQTIHVANADDVILVLGAGSIGQIATQVVMQTAMQTDIQAVSKDASNSSNTSGGD